LSLARAYSLIREQPWYRREAFSAGLRAAGFDVTENSHGPGKPGDLLLIWNRYGANHTAATAFEKAGGLVLVAENGYIGAGGSSPKFDVHPGGPKSTDYYALAVGGHNGQGTWPVGGPERWDALGIELQPWRREGAHILVCPNRAFGIPGRAMAQDWADRTAERLRKETKREVRIRRHPGNDAPKRPLEADLEGAWAVVIWSSNAGLHALVRGIPTYVESPFWVCHGARATGPIDDPVMPDRLPHLQAMAWAQWRLEEIESGAPFRALLG
jgi:hypothetical protein